MPARPPLIRVLVWPLALAALLALCHLVQAQETHTIAPGESVESIAQKHKVPVGKLKALNRISSSTKLKPGSVLLLPHIAPKAKRSKTLAAKTPPLALSPLRLLDPKTGPNLKSSYGGNPLDTKAHAGDMDWKPELRPAMDVMAPKDQYLREPEAPERRAPGLTATMHAKDNIDIIGVLNTPYEFTNQTKPYAKPDSSSGPAAAGGLMLRKSF